MKVGINASRSQDNEYTGIQTYSYALVDALIPYLQQDDLTLFFSSHNNIPQFKNKGYKEVITSHNCQSTIRRLFWENVTLSFEAKRQGVDIFHDLCGELPCFKSFKAVLTVHDLAYIAHPEFQNFRTKCYLYINYRRTVNEADHIISISKSTKKDLIKYFNVAPEKITVVYHGKDDRFRPKDSASSRLSVEHKYGVQGKFILFVSALSPRKNLEGLLKAFAKLKNSNLSLVCIGKTMWASKSIFQLIDKLGLRNRVIFVGYVRDPEDIVDFYNAALFSVYPSFYEGFGLPVLESMACGCPVIASDVASLPEIVPSREQLFDPHDTDSILNLLSQLEADPARRASIRNAGLEKAKEFSWQRSAEEVYKVYKGLMGE